MARFFNTAGPVNDRDHYCLSPLERFHLDEILLLIAQKKYFVLHAPRQTGKTSSLLALQTYLNETGHAVSTVARLQNLRVTGTAEILLKAKQEGLLSQVAPLLQQLNIAGFRLSDNVKNTILKLTRE